ncbi:MAG: perosamine synthetase [Planctomycetota bacterium]|jgi:perosamine synthetase
MRNIPYAKPSITQLEISAVTEAMTHGWGSRCYESLNKLQDEFASHMGTQFAFPTSSCTGALHMGLAALGIGHGDEVIVPDATWVASVAPITYLGAKPVFVDVLQDSWCIDPAQVEEAITPRTKAILVVHVYGNLVDMPAILEIAKRHGLAVIEDAAEAIGSMIGNQRAGSIGDIGVFSFHGTKTMTTGEGGMLVTNRADLAEQITILENHGRDPKVPKMFWCEQIGYKYRMSNIQAALGCAQLERIDELIQKKRKIFEWYTEAAQGITDLAWNPQPDGTLNSYWMPTVVLGEAHCIERDVLLSRLNEAGIGARPFFYPVSSFPMFDDQDTNPVSLRVGQRGFNLPSNFDMTREDTEYVVNTLRSLLDVKVCAEPS